MERVVIEEPRQLVGYRLGGAVDDLGGGVHPALLERFVVGIAGALGAQAHEAAGRLSVGRTEFGARTAGGNFGLRFAQARDILAEARPGGCAICCAPRA